MGIKIKEELLYKRWSSSFWRFAQKPLNKFKKMK